MNHRIIGFLAVVALVCGASAASAQRVGSPQASPVEGAAAVVPPGYVIGAADVLSIVFWRDKEMSGDVTVRPDGKISLPLLNEIAAAGITPEELRVRLVEAAGKFVEDPDVTVIVKEIHSRAVFITGNVAKPGSYPLTNDMTVLQLIAVAGGLQEYADKKNIVVNRTENGRQQFHSFNYKDVVSRKRTTDNIVLKPGDIVVVP